MATKATKKAVKKAEWKGYHKINLTVEQDAAFDAWFAQNVPDFNWVEALAHEGYKVSFNYDDYHTGVSAGLYAQSAKMEWAGWTLTAWGETAAEAFGMVCYKHYVVANQLWEVVEDRPEKAYKKRG